MTIHPRPSEVLSRRLLEFRSKRLWSQDEVASRMVAYGFSWVRSTVAKVELGTREVAVNELVALAFVLGVSPVSLLVPAETIAQQVHVTPNTVTGSDNAWHWMVGNQPMGGFYPDEILMPGDGSHEAAARFYNEACPDFVVTAEDRAPGLRKLQRQVAVLQQGIGCAEERVPRVFPRMLSDFEEAHATTGRLLEGFRAFLTSVQKTKNQGGKK